MVKQDRLLRRLLGRKIASDYLRRFVPLLPGASISVITAGGQVLAQAGSIPETAEPEVLPHSRFPFTIDEQIIGALEARGPGLSQPGTEHALRFLHHTLTLIIQRTMESRSLAQETLDRYREINLLYNIGETISASLDPDEIPDLVMAEAARIIRADGGVVLLIDQDSDFTPLSGFGEGKFHRLLHALTKPLLPEALSSGNPYIWTADQFAGYSGTRVASVLAAPLKAREHLLGFVLLGRGPELPVFTADDEKLLTALASQAAVAMENARLFADVKSQRDAIAAMKNYQDNIFASIASGVITTDYRDKVTMLNRAAERILAVDAHMTVGQPYCDALPGVGGKLASLVDTVKLQDESVVGYELQQMLPKRGDVVLRLNLSPLKDNRESTTGVAIVLDDLTAQRQLEAQVQQIRTTFEQYVAPRVVEQLLSDPTSVRLGGVRRDVTTMFADIRGFTAYSEKLEPEATVDVLIRYLTLAAEAILDEEGTLDKFHGDGVMALYNVPLAQQDPVLRAVRSAIAIRKAIAYVHKQLPPEQHLVFGFGITKGPAVVGSIGSKQIRNYTAIGDSVSLAHRLQSHAKPGQILLSAPAYEAVCDYVVSKELGYVQIKGHSAPDLVFEILDLKV